MINKTVHVVKPTYYSYCWFDKIWWDALLKVMGGGGKYLLLKWMSESADKGYISVERTGTSSGAIIVSR